MAATPTVHHPQRARGWTSRQALGQVQTYDDRIFRTFAVDNEQQAINLTKHGME
jgi:hypothetical protein